MEPYEPQKGDRHVAGFLAGILLTASVFFAFLAVQPQSSEAVVASAGTSPVDPTASGWKSFWQDPMKVLTGVLAGVAVFQAYLLFRQFWLMGKGLEATRVAADAAKRSADAAVATVAQLRPWLSTDSPTLSLSVPKISYGFIVKNLGPVPAAVIGYEHSGFLFLDNATLAANIRAHSEQNKLREREFYAPPGIEIPFDGDFDLDNESLAEIMGGSKVFGVAVVLNYRSVNGAAVFTYRECFVYDRDIQDFRIHADCNYMD